MKVVTRSVMIEGEEFVLIKNEDERYYSKDHSYYGTISVKDLDEKGRLTRELNGFDMCIEETIGGALQRRQNQILCRRFLDENPDVDMVEGKNVDKYFEFINTLNYKY